MGRIDPLPSEAELEAWYAGQYREAYKGCEKPTMKYVLRAAKNAKARYDWLRQNYLKNFANARLKTLDIGASSGEFVSLMGHQCHDAYGIEPHQGYAEYAQSMGLKIVNSPALDGLQKFEEKSFDLITMYHVLEHLVNPLKSLEAIGASLKDTGILYIEVPNATRYCSPTYMFFSAHTLYFDSGSLKHTLECAGFEVVLQNAPDSDNLRILARYAGKPVEMRERVHHHELVQAQRKRQWLPYLWSQFLKGEPFVRFFKKYKESKAARSHTDPAELMRKLYS